MNCRIVLLCFFCYISIPAKSQLKQYAFRIDGGATLTNGDIDPPAIMFGVGGEYYHSIKSSYGLMLTADVYSIEKETRGLPDENWYKELFVSAGQLSIEPFYSYKFRTEEDQSHFYFTVGTGVYKSFARATLGEGEYEFLGEFEKSGEIRHTYTRWTKLSSRTTDKENYLSAWKFKWSLQFGYDNIFPSSWGIIGVYLKYHNFDDLEPLNIIKNRPINNDFYFRNSTEVLPVKIGVTFKFTGKDKMTRQRERKARKFLSQHQTN